MPKKDKHVLNFHPFDGSVCYPQCREVDAMSLRGSEIRFLNFARRIKEIRMNCCSNGNFPIEATHFENGVHRTARGASEIIDDYF